ncbi:hypothetical protein [Streptosporangium sp. KLBMP 9127]|nr:hypothetical protein [Streptosporangium sp. KLBMP 9127]
MPVYIAVLLFGLCAVVSFIFAIITWDGTSRNLEVTTAVIGMAVTHYITGNIDFAISATLTVACTVALFAVLLAFRLGFARWVLAFVGGVVIAYYLYALLYVLINGGGGFVVLLALSLVLWISAVVTVLLPAVGRGLRGR